MTDLNDETTETGTAEATREELLAAVRAAGGTESAAADVEAEAAADAAQSSDPAAAGAETQTTEAEEPKITRLLRERAKAHEEREAARNHAEEIRRAAEEERQRILSDAKEEARRLAAEELRAETDRKRREFAESQDGTPEARELAKLRLELEAAKQKTDGAAGGAEEVKKALEELRAERQREKYEAQVAQVRSKFFEVATPDTFKALHTRYDEQEIFQKANAVAIEWQKKGLRLHADFDFADVASHLDSEAKKHFAARGISLDASSPARQVSAGAPAKEPGLATKVTANGSRTLSAASGSERRTSPKPIAEMTPEEARAALIEEVAAVRRTNPDAKM